MGMRWQDLLSSARQGQKKGGHASSRSAFEQDYDRIVFSQPFRRLQDKTQVHPLPEHDFVHTRLTHSLEVSVVGRSLGRKAGEVILTRYPELTDHFSLFDFGAITAAASLAHDLGNPPFGHAGEDALSDFFAHTEYGATFKDLVTATQWTDLTKFEGNAQGFRILNSNTWGLHLTQATLGAFTKYPCASSIEHRDKARKSQKKFGYFETESEAFRELAGDLGLLPLSGNGWCRHPLTLLVEAADDICYNIIDLEDACRLGLVSFRDTVDLLADIIGKGYDSRKLERIHGQNEKIGVLRAMAIGRLVDECTDVFLQHERQILTGEFDASLTDHCHSSEVLRRIASTSIEKIYRARHVLEIEASGHEVLPGLLNEFLRAGQLIFDAKRSGAKIPRKHQNIALLLPEETRFLINKSESLYQVIRFVLDFVSGMTDKHALVLFRKIKGISL